MSELLLLKKEDCKSCYKCIRECALKSIRFSENRAQIVERECVYCGHCYVTCPQSAKEIRRDTDKAKALIASGRPVIVSLAPSFIADFGVGGLDGMRQALLKLGFADVVEVAIGADLCTIEESRDFLEKVPAQQPFMGTSCCPAWSVMAKKLFPEFKDYISMALTPMVITARMVKKAHPDAQICFIGPCAAKKLEANRRSVRSDVDYVLTFEDLQGMFDAKKIVPAEIEAEESESMHEGSAMGRGYAVGGGVAAAVVETIKQLDPDREVPTDYGDGLRECRKMLTMAKAGKRNGYLLEGMACPGGCVAGAGTIRPVRESAMNVTQFKQRAKLQSAMETPFAARLKDVEE